MVYEFVALCSTSEPVLSLLSMPASLREPWMRPSFARENCCGSVLLHHTLAARVLQIYCRARSPVRRTRTADVDAIPRTVLTKFGAANYRVAAAEYAGYFCAIPEDARASSSVFPAETCTT